MPAFMEPQVVFRGPSFPPQYLEPKYEGSMDHQVGFHIHVAPTTDSDYLHPDPYNHSRHPTGPAPTYNGYGAFYNDSAAVPHHMGAPMIQPLQIDNRYVSHRNGYESRQHSNHVVQTQVPQDEKVVGGVSAQLDYDMAQMTDFVVEMSVAVIQPDTYDEVLFRKWVLQVLNATRLPSATIVLSLSYLSLRVRGLASSNLHLPTERGLYQMLTVALILGSKFLDDNTFQNKSWAEVSNISVAELNLDEMHWLAAFKHRLHHNPAVADGFNCWEAKWTAFKSRPTISTTLHPLDTSQRRHVNGRQSTSPARYAHQYPIQAMSAISLESSGNPPAYTPSFPAYDAWYGRRSSDRSPSTASHTGPNTPEYYDNRRWGPSQARPGRDEQYTLGDAANMTPGTVAFRPSYDPPAYAVKQSIWNCHGHACQCANCRNAQPFQPRFGPVIAA